MVCSTEVSTIQRLFTCKIFCYAEASTIEYVTGSTVENGERRLCELAQYFKRAVTSVYCRPELSTTGLEAMLM